MYLIHSPQPEHGMHLHPHTAPRERGPLGIAKSSATAVIKDLENNAKEESFKNRCFKYGEEEQSLHKCQRMLIKENSIRPFLYQLMERQKVVPLICRKKDLGQKYL